MSPSIYKKDASHHDQIPKYGQSQTVKRFGFRVFRTEAAAVHIQSDRDTITQHNYKKQQQAG
jgi:hypothetical protein